MKGAIRCSEKEYQENPDGVDREGVTLVENSLLFSFLTLV